MNFIAVVAVFSILFAPLSRPAADVCTESLTWSFSSSLPTEWQDPTHTWSSNSGQDGSPGIMRYVYVPAGPYGNNYLTTEEILALLEYPSDYHIWSNGITWTGYMLGSSNTLSSVYFTYTDDSFNSTSLIGNNSWRSMSLAANSNLFLESLWVRSVGTSSVYYDAFTLTIPCANFLEPDAPTPTPTPSPSPTPDPAGTATPTPTPSPEPTSVFSYTATITPFLDIPGPIDLPPITQTIDLEPFWNIDAISAGISVVQTFFYLENIPQLFAIFLPVMGMIIGLRLVMRIIRDRRARSEEV